jgi:hypothetical protein
LTACVAREPSLFIANPCLLLRRMMHLKGALTRPFP